MDTYQPIYDAVRSKISNVDIGSIVNDWLRSQDFSFQIDQIKNEFTNIAYECKDHLFYLNQN